MPTRRNYVKVRNKASLQCGCVSVLFPFLTDDAFIKHVPLLITAAIRGVLVKQLQHVLLPAQGIIPRGFHSSAALYYRHPSVPAWGL